jgi:hypothetical protein
MVFGLNTSTTSAHNKCTSSRTTPLVTKLAFVRTLESNVCHEKTTTFEGAKLSHTLCTTPQVYVDKGEEAANQEDKNS